MRRVFFEQSANGESLSIRWGGGVGTVCVSGTWGGGTATLQMSPDEETTWFDVGEDAIFTQDGIANFQLAGGCHVRLLLSNATNPSLNAWIA